MITTAIYEIWGVKFDESKTNTWYRILKGLKPERLLLALDSLIKEPPINPYTAEPELRFAPNLTQIIDRYEQIRKRDTAAARKKAIDSQQKLLASQAAGQGRCSICNNTGDVFYEREGYEYHCRCSCARGQDLARWNRGSIIKGGMSTNAKTGLVENTYYPDVNDVLSAEEIGIMRAKNVSRREGPKIDISEIKARVAKGIRADNLDYSWEA
jgi:hypothetical protein